MKHEYITLNAVAQHIVADMYKAVEQDTASPGWKVVGMSFCGMAEVEPKIVSGFRSQKQSVPLFTLVIYKAFADEETVVFPSFMTAERKVL